MRLSRLARGLTLALAVLSSGCAAMVAAEKSSPTQFGVGLWATPQVAETESGAIHAVGAVQRQSWDGGHDNIFTAGLQLRRPLGDGAWYGAEANYNNWRVHPESVSPGFESPGLSDITPVSHVVGLGGLYGRPLGESGVGLISSFQFLLFGDFMNDGSVWSDGGLGYQLSVGVEFNPLNR